MSLTARWSLWTAGAPSRADTTPPLMHNQIMDQSGDKRKKKKIFIFILKKEH